MNSTACGKIVLLVFLATLLSAAAALAQNRDVWTPPPLADIQKNARNSSTARNGDSTERIIFPSAVKLTFPAAGATVRGIVDVKVSGIEQSGYIVFRVDNQFAYATTAPFKMQWDTLGAEDGDHIIRASGYAADKTYIGDAIVRVTIQNHIEGGVPAGGLAITLHPVVGETIVKNAEGISDVAGLGAENKLPNHLRPLRSRFYARFSQSVTAVNDLDRSANLRTTVRSGVISTDDGDIDIPESNHYGIATLSSSGLESPPPPGSKSPAIGLGELSLALPTGPLHEGMTWRSPIRVMPDLVQRKTIEVEGTHTFEGLWWFKGRKCARIFSKFEIGDVAVTGSAGAQQQAGVATGLTLELTQGRRAGMMGRRSAMGGRTGGANARRTQTTPRAGTAGVAVRTPQIAAILSGLTGTRITWIDIRRGLIIRSEDEISGTLALTGPLPTATPARVNALPSQTIAVQPDEPSTGLALALTAMPGGGGRPGAGGRPGGGARQGGGAARAGGSTGRSTTGGGRTAAGRAGGGSFPQRSILIRPRTTEEDISAEGSQRLPYSLILVIEAAN